MPPSDKTAIQCVIEVDQERIRLEKEAEYLATKDDVGKSSQKYSFCSRFTCLYMYCLGIPARLNDFCGD